MQYDTWGWIKLPRTVLVLPLLLSFMQGVQDHIDGLTAELGKSLKKEMQETGAVCQAQFAELCNQLADKKAQIAAKTEAYQKVVACPMSASSHSCSR